MNKKHIYHYTTIDTLALILRNHTIRFSRLDKVDDIEESEFSSGPTNVRLGNYVFASCWTRCEEESIAQWKIYAGYDGVRIAMAEDDIFQTYDITPEFPNSMQSYFKPPFSPVGKDAICCPRINPVVCEDVVYTDDPTLLAKDAIIDTGTHTVLSTTSAGKYKRKIWEFQKKCRFKFLVYPMQESIVEYLAKTEIDINLIFPISNQGIMNIIQKKMPISQEYYDASMSATALDHLQVILGPRTSVAQETIVEALLNQYAPKAVLRQSELKLRKKQDRLALIHYHYDIRRNPK